MDKKRHPPAGGYFFKKGNKYGKGRPKISLKKPDILLPAIFYKAKINWARDFTQAYRAIREGTATDSQMLLFRTIKDLLPNLVTKITLKEIELKKLIDANESASMKKTSDNLIKSLEAEIDAKRTTGSNPSSMEGGQPPLPPPSLPA